jgi:nitrite reductase/ring-hydroxylating ferredoxin subunit
VTEIDDDALAAAREELNSDPIEERRTFIYACELAEIPSSRLRGKVIEAAQEEIALVNIDGEILAFSNICPHEQSPLLAAGFFDKARCAVACPLHGWLYDMRTGERLDAPGSIPVYRTRVSREQVFVEILLDEETGSPAL